MASAQALQRLFALDGEVALVTGAGSGIGAATARLLAQAGAQMICADRNIEAAEVTAAAIRADGGEATSAEVDVASDVSVSGLFAEISARPGRLDLLVNNAGVYPKHDFLEIDADAWDRVQDVNLRGAYFCMRGALELMKRTRRRTHRQHRLDRRAAPADLRQQPLRRQQGRGPRADPRGGAGIRRARRALQCGAPGRRRHRGRSPPRGVGTPHPGTDDESRSHPARPARRAGGHRCRRPLPRLSRRRLCHRPRPGGRWRLFGELTP